MNKSEYLKMDMEKDWPRSPEFENVFLDIRMLFPAMPNPQGELL